MIIKKDEYVKKLKSQLDKWHTELYHLEEKAKQVGENTKIKYEDEIKEVKGYLETIKRKISEIQNSGGDSWKEMKKG